MAASPKKTMQEKSKSEGAGPQAKKKGNNSAISFSEDNAGSNSMRMTTRSSSLSKKAGGISSTTETGKS
jgi:hypothetical protein